MSRDVKQQASEQVDAIARRYGLAGRSGGNESVSAFAGRVARVPRTVTTYADDAPHDGALDALAEAVLHVERLQAEYDDAQAGDVALMRARALLVEAGALLETLARVDPHKERRAKARP